jgi:hypothetical protein
VGFFCLKEYGSAASYCAEGNGHSDSIKKVLVVVQLIASYEELCTIDVGSIADCVSLILV